MTDMLFCEKHQAGIHHPVGYDRSHQYLPDEACPTCLRDEVTRLEKVLAGLESANRSVELFDCADDIRRLGWAVAVHNDYKLNGEKFTFWLFTKGNTNVKGEGRTDREALDQVRNQIATSWD